MENKELFEFLTDTALKLGAFKAKVIDAEKVETDRSFRAICESNSCGAFGRCWACPPDCGDIDELMASLKDYRYALVFQTVGELEDSYDFEGMIEHKKSYVRILDKLRAEARKVLSKALYLGAGGCGMCDECAKRRGEPCVDPENAIVSLEAYGVNVSRLAAVSDMKYINGKDTVTYFGAIFF